MNLFIDTNVFLSFYEYSSEDLDQLEQLTAYIKTDNVILHLPEQVKHEYLRGRDGTLNRAMKDFRNPRLLSRFPRMAMDYDEYNSLHKYINKCHEAHKLLMEVLEKDISEGNLKADNLIRNVFALSKFVPTDDGIIAAARNRADLGNPPGKPRSIGDATIWEALLESVPENQVFCLISQDADFLSPYNQKTLHPFLENEWLERKGIKPNFFSTLSEAARFLEIRIIWNRFQEIEYAIRFLAHSFSFSSTHQNVIDLKNLDAHFTIRQFNRLLVAVPRNSQIDWIFWDHDVVEFYWNLTEGRLGEIYRETLEEFQPWLRESMNRLEYGEIPVEMMGRFQDILDLDPSQASSEDDDDIPF